MLDDIKKYKQIVESSLLVRRPLKEMATPPVSKPIPDDKLSDIVLLHDEEDNELNLIAFENKMAADLFDRLQEALDSQGRSAGFFQYDTNIVEQTEGYEDWVSRGAHAVSWAYLKWAAPLIRNSDEDDDDFRTYVNFSENEDVILQMTSRDQKLLQDDF